MFLDEKVRIKKAKPRVYRFGGWISYYAKQPTNSEDPRSFTVQVRMVISRTLVRYRFKQKLTSLTTFARRDQFADIPDSFLFSPAVLHTRITT